jgi:hypothetical protein
MLCCQIGEVNILLYQEGTDRNRGMGGNQAMRDVATALPLLQKLAQIKAISGELSQATVTKTCQEYEDEMIPRAFEWVQKSGGMSIVVSPPFLCQVPNFHADVCSLLILLL